MPPRCNRCHRHTMAGGAAAWLGLCWACWEAEPKDTLSDGLYDDGTPWGVVEAFANGGRA